MRHAWLVSLSLVAIGCVSDPRDPQTWIKKLDSPVEQKDAVRELARLKDPVLELLQSAMAGQALTQLEAGSVDDAVAALATTGTAAVGT